MRTTLIALLATALVGFCEEPGKPEVEKPTQTETKTSATLPAVRTFTDLKGRAMEGTVVGKNEKAITFVRASDKKKFEIALETLAEADKVFVAGLVAAPVKKEGAADEANIKNSSPIPFEKGPGREWKFNYGYHVLLRVDGQIYAIKAEGVPCRRPKRDIKDTCFYAIKYEVVKFAKAAVKGRTIKSEKLDASGERIHGCAIDCDDFMLLWRPAGNKTGYFDFTVNTAGKYSDMGVPRGTEYYNQQLPTLDSVSVLDPKGWLPIR